MSKSFAEQIIDSMVDENGRCGERGLSAKQFGVLAKYLKPQKTENVGFWHGDYSDIVFTSTDFTGVIGRYVVKLNEYCHFHSRYTVVDIHPWCDEVPDTSNSNYQHDVNDRVDLNLIMLSEREFDSYYGTKYVYTLVDGSGNVYTWFTSNLLAYRDKDNCDNDVFADPGDMVHIKGTVKDHTEFRGTKQTVLTRCKVVNVKKYDRAA